jgi:hypothetical protein
MSAWLPAHPGAASPLSARRGHRRAGSECLRWVDCVEKVEFSCRSQFECAQTSVRRIPLGVRRKGAYRRVRASQARYEPDHKRERCSARKSAFLRVVHFSTFSTQSVDSASSLRGKKCRKWGESGPADHPSLRPECAQPRRSWESRYSSEADVRAPRPIDCCGLKAVIPPATPPYVDLQPSARSAA